MKLYVGTAEKEFLNKKKVFAKKKYRLVLYYNTTHY